MGGVGREETVASVRDLVVDFDLPHGRSVRAVDHVTVDLHPGEILGVVGESGSGKSTLGRVIAGFERPTSGSVSYSEGSLPTASRRGRRDVQLIFQEAALALSPRLPAWRAVAEAIAPNLPTLLPIRRGRLTGLREDACGYLRQVGLREDLHADKRPDELSGGEKQRVAIARALAAHPRALVCDESVSALDVSIRATVLNLLGRLSSRRGIALFFISHDISVVGHLAHRVVVMNEGRIVEEGRTQQVIEAPTHPYTKQLLAAVPVLERG